MNQLICFFLSISVFLSACENSSSNKDSANNTETATQTNSSSQNASNASSIEEVQGDGIIGEWQLKMKILDSNGNNKMDEVEKNDPITVSDEDYLKFNADGSGLIYSIKKEGRYEIKNNESSGKKYVTWYDEKNNVLRKMGHIYSVTKDELILLDKFAGATFSIYKRI